MRDFFKIGSLISALAAVLVISACGGGGSSSTGTLGASVTDAPACGFDHVYVTVSEVRVHQSGDPNVADNDPGWSNIVLSSPLRIDLLGLTNGILASLGQTALPAGHYQQLRLVLVPNTGNAAPFAESVVPSGGVETALTIPSGIQSGIKLINQFDVAANTRADVVLDFDACHSVVANGSGAYVLKPVISVFPMAVSGVIEGWIDPALAASTAVIVSAQVFDGKKSLSVVRTTIADPTTGKFVLSPVPESSLQPASYELVITANNHATAQISGITLAASSTVSVNTSSTPIGLDVSAMNTASGTVSIGGSTSNVDATVQALQTFANAAQGEVAFATVNMAGGGYSIALPGAAPKSANFNAGMPLAFTTVPASAGMYTLLAVTGTGTQQTAAIDVSSVNVTQNFAF